MLPLPSGKGKSTFKNVKKNPNGHIEFLVVFHPNQKYNFELLNDNYCFLPNIIT